MLALLPLVGSGCATTSSSRVAPTTQLGQRAYTISDGVTEAVIVPDWRRVMSLNRVGQKNVLFNSFKLPDTRSENVFANFGGEKAWLWPQDQWVNASGVLTMFPPPDDNGASAGLNVVDVSHDTLTLETGVMKTAPVFMRRTYRIEKDGALHVRTQTRPADGAVVDTKWRVWSVLQLPRPLRVEARLKGEKRYKPMSSGVPLSSDGTTAVMHPFGATYGKVGLDADQLVAIYDTFRIVFTHTNPPEFVTGAELAQLYVTNFSKTDPREEYIELEFLAGPVKSPGVSALDVSIAIVPNP